MQMVVCENPRCNRMIPKHEAHEFEDSDYWKHYSCNNTICTIKAVLEVERKERDLFTFTEAIECCK